MADLLDKVRKRVEARPRLAGYYIVRSYAIEPPERTALEEQLSRAAADSGLGSITNWNEHEVSRDVAREWAGRGLQGGPEIGHEDFTIQPAEAFAIVDEFLGLFGSGSRYFINAAADFQSWEQWGNRDHVYSSGVVVAGTNRLGFLWVVESD